MIIGNGEIGPEAAAAVADAAFVIRFNECRSYEASRGRTDVVAVCNTGRPAKAMLASQSWREHPGVREAAAVWSVRDPQKFAELRAPLAVTHPELDDFCDDYTQQFNAFCAEVGKAHVVVDKVIHETVDRALAAYLPAPYVVPSSGMIVIAEVMNRFPEAAIDLAGFGHAGWEWHPFAAERQLVDSYVAAGRVTRLPARASYSSSQGA
ncbi:hypothetical protein QO004_005604 [Rhizobium mesoamericanum]|uniref:Urease operon accessory protein n=1 Tax=Rhizobium mesoamericanum TaxID=1079800 RepID=UPI002783DD4A|nr:Urease operon accessory protein [Rhizobium mesoamericanum]MDQ0563788.1 hypothetical protein [Rhizobium mesoamericanum]